MRAIVVRHGRSVDPYDAYFSNFLKAKNRKSATAKLLQDGEEWNLRGVVTLVVNPAEKR
jgi:hypothetical protein